MNATVLARCEVPGIEVQTWFLGGSIDNRHRRAEGATAVLRPGIERSVLCIEQQMNGAIRAALGFDDVWRTRNSNYTDAIRHVTRVSGQKRKCAKPGERITAEQRAWSSFHKAVISRRQAGVNCACLGRSGAAQILIGRVPDGLLENTAFQRRERVARGQS